jgi:hypothetical protein
MVLSIRVLQNVGDFLNRWETIGFWKQRILLYGVGQQVASVRIVTASSRCYKVQASVMLSEVNSKIGKEVSRKSKEIWTSWYRKWKYRYPSTADTALAFRSAWIFNNTAVETSNVTSHPYFRACAVWNAQAQATTSYGSSWVVFYFHVMTETEPGSKTLVVLVWQNRRDRQYMYHLQTLPNTCIIYRIVVTEVIWN